MSDTTRRKTTTKLTDFKPLQEEVIKLRRQKAELLEALQRILKTGYYDTEVGNAAIELLKRIDPCIQL